MFIDVACSQKKKYNQNAYGDFFTSHRFPSMNRVVAVLSDGLGSGIKANILACMTSTMLLKLLCTYNHNCGLLENCVPRNYDTLKNDLLKMMMNEDNIIDWLLYYREVRNTLIQGE